jgi:hypothetical protein
MGHLHKLPLPTDMEYPFHIPQSPIPRSSPPYFGQLTHMLYFGYLGRTFGPLAAKRHLCHNVLCYVEDQEDLVVNQELLRPDHSYPGLPGTFSVSHDPYPYLRCNAIAGDHSRRIILDCEISDSATARVVPQSLFAPYAGLPRSKAELQSACLLPPIFFIRLDGSVGLPLETAKTAESQSPLLLYGDWHPMEGKASIKMRIAVGPVLISLDLRSLTCPLCCSGMAICHGRLRSNFETAEKSPSLSRGWCNSWPAGWIAFYG